jgi:Serine dehydrogenase proteinase
MGAEQRKPIIEEIQQKRGGSRLLCCLTSDRDNAQGQIAKDFLFRFFQHLRTTPNLEKLDVLMFTLGGDTLAAYALGRLVRQFAKKVSVLVPHLCFSGGTLFSLVADEIVMTRLANLGAIDPSITGPLNPTTDLLLPGMVGVPGQKLPVPVAVESVAGFRKLVEEHWKLGENGTNQAFALLADKVHPLLLGDLQRSREQIVRLATNLMKLHATKMEDAQIAKVVQTLAIDLGSHDYMIGRVEAREVGLNIVDEDLALEELVWRLYQDFSGEMELGTPFDPMEGITFQPGQQIRPVTKTSKMVIIESLERSDVWEREMLILPPNQMQIKRNHWRK